MKISLVTATLGRVDEINILLDSLVKQTYKNFELIIVDQNEHYKVQNIVDIRPAESINTLCIVAYYAYIVKTVS